MAYYETLNLVQGDTLPELNFTLTDSNADDAPINLTDATVRLKFRALGDAEPKSIIQMTRHAPYTDGKVFLQWPEGVLDTAGTFTGEIEITYGNGKVQTVFDQMKFKVRGEY